MRKEHKKLEIARVTIETLLPLSIGSGQADLFLDMPIALDANDLPYIPGTSIAGVLRSSLRDFAGVDELKLNGTFGFQNGSQGASSTLIFSSAHLVGSKKHVAEGLLNRQNDRFEDVFLNQILHKGIETRDRVRINHKGTAVEGAKYDISMLVPGARFVFDIKYWHNEDAELWNTLLGLLKNQLVRFGRSTRSGFGAFEVLNIQHRGFDFTESQDLLDYTRWSGSFNDALPQAKPVQLSEQESEHIIKYELKLTPDDFFLFSSGKKGAQSGEADMASLTGTRITWNVDTPEFIEGEIVIPASSIKGALAHRTLFHFNLFNKFFADQKIIPDSEDEMKLPLNKLFGFAKNDKEKKDTKDEHTGMAGKLRFSDGYLKIKPQEFVEIAHVSIDRLTQGNIQGALFNEEVASTQREISMEILLDTTNLDELNSEHLLDAFECALKDLTEKRLPLGGGVNRGHGRFSGTCTKNGMELWKQ